MDEGVTVVETEQKVRKFFIQEVSIIADQRLQPANEQKTICLLFVNCGTSNPFLLPVVF